jgi:hypothetical protein
MACRSKFCSFCNKYDHTSKECKIEKDTSIKLKLLVGNMMEHYAANNIKCPECNCNSLCVIGDNTPSCDIICNNCNKMFEIKSKCLSCDVIPDDIMINHGHFDKFLSKINEGLNIIVIIYSVNRYNKSITIREILYINNTLIKNNKLITISKKKDSNYTLITINNRKLLNKLIIYNFNSISFKNEINII